MHIHILIPISQKAVAALWEHQDTEIEAVHFAIALAYHGLLRVPSRAETSDMTPRTCPFGFDLIWLICLESVFVSCFTASAEYSNDCMALCEAVREDGRQGSASIRVLRLSGS